MFGAGSPVALLAAVALCAGTLALAASPSSAAATARSRRSGPAAELSRLTGGQGVYLAEPVPTDLHQLDYVQREYAAAGVATSYTPAGALTRDGRWTFLPDATAPYRTRVLVRAPEQRAAFNGTVMVEWLNVSGGVDADPEWVSTSEEIVRSGGVWVGVSAQRIGVEGGPVLVTVNVPGAETAGKGLKAIDPARYGALTHPGDGFSFDIFTQVARAIRSGDGLNGLRPRRVIAAGESQSAFALVTYFNGVQPRSHAFDGFFVHSRGGSALPLVGPGKFADIVGAITGTPTIFRTDQETPVLDIQTETDLTSVLNSYAARQPDNEHFRLWEVPGTAHADAHLIGPMTLKYIDCGVPINNGPMHVVAKAALHALTTWITTDDAPPHAPRIDVASGPSPQIVRNADGIARGGIRTPPVDVPVATLSGVPGPNPSTICLLLGSTKPLSSARLAALYPSRGEYLERYRADVAETIRAGFALRSDRSALLAFADPSRIPH